MDPYLTEEEIQFLEEDARQWFIKADKKHRLGFFNKPKTKPKILTSVAVAVNKTSIQQSKNELETLNWLRGKMRAADPVLLKNFMDKVEGVELQNE